MNFTNDNYTKDIIQMISHKRTSKVGIKLADFYLF